MKKNKLQCSNCGIFLDGWLYYELNNFRFCHFCYNSFELKGDETDKDYKISDKGSK